MTQSFFARRFLAPVAMALVTTAAFAQDYPARPVRIVVPFPAGGSSDLHSRSLAQRLSRLWAQQVVVENISGAGGGVAAANVARSRPTGETIFFATHPIFAINRATNKVPQDPAYRKEMQDQGIDLDGGTPEQFKTFLLNERRKWGGLLNRLNIKAE